MRIWAIFRSSVIADLFPFLGWFYCRVLPLRLLCTGCRLSGSLGTPWLICPGFIARLLVPRLWAVRFLWVSSRLVWFLCHGYGLSLMFFGCLCPGCGLG